MRLLAESGDAAALVDATSQLDEQIQAVTSLDALLLTHAHREPPLARPSAG